MSILVLFYSTDRTCEHSSWGALPLDTSGTVEGLGGIVGMIYRIIHTYLQWCIIIWRTTKNELS